eukprot:15143532-Alexandrium_andersonii.AAC.1
MYPKRKLPSASVRNPPCGTRETASHLEPQWSQRAPCKLASTVSRDRGPHSSDNSSVGYTCHSPLRPGQALLGYRSPQV